MTRKKNKGLTMVEIMIAIAVFAILLIPIVKGLILSMDSSTNAKETQYRNDYALEILEYVKTDSIDNILSGDFLSKNGSTNITSSSTVMWEVTSGTWKSEGSLSPTEKNDVDTKVITNSYDSYELNGKVRLGTDHTLYSYKVQIDNKYYYDKSKEAATVDKDGDEDVDNDDKYKDPNKVEFGVVENLENGKVALIDGRTLANYDDAIQSEFQARVVDEMRNAADQTDYQQYMSQQSFTFTDSVYRVITLSVSGNKTDGYDVKADLDYYDDNKYLNLSKPSGAALMNDLNHINKVMYNIHFDDPTPADTTDEFIPNIYLMYNPFRYNGYYTADDYIVFDCTGVTDDTEVNAFIVESAEQYSANIKNTLADRASTNPSDASAGVIGNIGNDTNRVYTKQTSTGTIDRSNVDIHMIAVENSTNISNNEYKSLKRLNIYHNFFNDVVSGVVNSNKKNDSVSYAVGEEEADDGTKTDHSTPIDTFVSSLYGDLYSGKNLLPLMQFNSDKIGDKSVMSFGLLDEANQEERGLYTVRIYMEEGDVTIDTSNSEPILEGSKGGGES